MSSHKRVFFLTAGRERMGGAGGITTGAGRGASTRLGAETADEDALERDGALEAVLEA